MPKYDRLSMAHHPPKPVDCQAKRQKTDVQERHTKRILFHPRKSVRLADSSCCS